MQENEKKTNEAQETTAETTAAETCAKTETSTDGAVKDQAAPAAEKKAADKPEEKAAEKPEEKGGKEKKLIAKITAELESAKAECAKTKDLFLRTAAEYDNFRKRTGKEKESAFSDGMAHAAEKVLPVIDTLEMAASAETADENYKKGVLMTLEKARGMLKELGFEEIAAQDAPFDPQLHSAVMQQPVEGVKAGTVVQVYQKGYTLNGRVVRHAMVVVSA